VVRGLRGGGGGGVCSADVRGLWGGGGGGAFIDRFRLIGTHIRTNTNLCLHIWSTREEAQFASERQPVRQ